MAENDYGFDKSWSQEQRRLALIEQCYDPRTMERLDRLGVATGWRCLEIGAGNGSISRWLCNRVAPEGRVVAMDLDTRFIEDEAGIEVRQGDFLTEPVEENFYDLVLCRAVLHHLPGRQVEALRKMRAALRSGGILLAEEPWMGALRASRKSVCAAAWEAFDAVVPADYTFALELPQALFEAGLTDIGAVGEAATIPGGTALAELIQLTLEAVRPRVTAVSDFDAAAEIYADPNVFEPGPVWYAAWGKRA
jgi:SAM-dependent methyltransferase